jgi:hypothetical protein
MGAIIESLLQAVFSFVHILCTHDVSKPATLPITAKCTARMSKPPFMFPAGPSLGKTALFLQLRDVPKELHLLS